MTIKGLFAVWRAVALDPARIEFGTATSDLPTLLGAAGLPSAKAWLPWLIALGVAAWALASAQFRKTREMVMAGIVIGLVIVAGWYLSGHIGHLAEDPATLEEKFVATNTGRMESFSFVAPFAYTLDWLMFYSDASKLLTIGIVSVDGMLAGAALGALLSGEFRWEGFASTEDLANHVVGGILMGFGGVTALGCTIGQGLSGLSTLAVGSFLAFFSIIGGCLAALRYQMWRIDRQDSSAGSAVNAAAPLDVSRS